MVLFVIPNGSQKDCPRYTSVELKIAADKVSGMGGRRGPPLSACEDDHMAFVFSLSGAVWVRHTLVVSSWPLLCFPSFGTGTDGEYEDEGIIIRVEILWDRACGWNCWLYTGCNDDGSSSIWNGWEILYWKEWPEFMANGTASASLLSAIWNGEDSNNCPKGPGILLFDPSFAPRGWGNIPNSWRLRGATITGIRFLFPKLSSCGASSSALALEDWRVYSDLIGLLFRSNSSARLDFVLGPYSLG